MKARYVGIIFIAAVIVPSILLAVLSIRAAGKEEALVETQLQTTLLAEVTSTAGQVNDQVGRIAEELRGGIEVSSTADFGQILTQWKGRVALVEVPFLLSPRYGILWPDAGGKLSDTESRFIQENGDFLGNRAATPVYQNIALKYQDEILDTVRQKESDSTPVAISDSEKKASEKAPEKAQKKPASELLAEGSRAAGSAGGSAAGSTAGSVAGSADRSTAGPVADSAADTTLDLAEAPLAIDDKTAVHSSALASQQAIDAFAQSPAIQAKVYDEAQKKGDQLNTRVVQPTAKMALNTAPASVAPAAAAPASTASSASVVSPAPSLAAPASVEEPFGGNEPSGAGELLGSGVATETSTETSRERSARDESKSEAAGAGEAEVAATGQATKEEAPAEQAVTTQATTEQATAQPAASGKAKAQSRSEAKDAKTISEPVSQFVTTSQLLSQIASQGDYGIIPRFIGERLTFLFWERQPDGRIAGCQISAPVFRDRIAAVLPGTFSLPRIITILDETGAPLATPPDSAGRDWRRPFVSREIGQSLPRWEVASYLTSPDAITARARSSSIVIWVLVLILFVSVAGGGTMVLSSVYGEMRLAQKKATFVTNVSHELKTPLTSISLFVELLRQKRQTDPEKQQRYFSLMASETERLTRLINNVLDFSAIERGRKKYDRKHVDAATIAREIVESQRVRLESRGFTLSFAAARDDTRDAASNHDSGTRVMADGEALKQVILNLLSNAEKYSPRNKEIEVEVAREGDSIAIHVRDRGIGVADADRERIFREFFRVDQSLTARVQGSGLGLTIARRIARDHGGDVRCRPRDGGGSDFVVTLPAADKEAP